MCTCYPTCETYCEAVTCGTLPGTDLPAYQIQMWGYVNIGDGIYNPCLYEEFCGCDSP